MQGRLDNGVCRRQSRAQFIGFRELASQFCFPTAVPVNVSVRHVASDDRARTFPTDLYRRISFAAWGTTIIGGALSWTALLHLI